MGSLFSSKFGMTEIFLSLVTIILIYIINYYYKYLIRQNPLPGPIPLPIVGNFYLFHPDDYSSFVKKCYEKYGDTFEIYLGSDRQICVGRLDDYDKLFNPSSKTSFKLRSLHKPEFDELGVSGYGIVFNHNYDSWQFNRQFFNQAMLTPSFFRLALSQTQDYLKELTDYWNGLSDKNIEFDLKKWLPCFVSDNFLDLFIGKRDYCMDNYYSSLIGKKSEFSGEQLVDHLARYVKCFVFHMFVGSFAKYVPVLNVMAKEHMDNRDNYWNFLYKVINDHRKFIESTPKDQLRSDMITLLLTANTDHDINASMKKIKDLNPEFQRPMNDKELLINLSEAIGGGVDSTSNLLTFLVYYLCKNPIIITNLRLEITEILGKDFRQINVDDLDKFKYMEAVIKETARLSSITPLIDRYNCASEQVAGYTWPPNTHFIINSSGTQSDPKFWKNPEIFDPERFINVDDNNISNLKALTLFGGGIRICPGRKLAMIILKSFIATLVHKFDFELVNNDKPIKVKFAVFNQPNELFIKVKKREIY